MSQAKQEKAAIDAKVAKVREIVKHVSNNDIILALHNFDMDVNKTIHAFTEVGVENALGSWQKNGVANKKKKNKDKKNGAGAPVPAAPAKPAPKPTTSQPAAAVAAPKPDVSAQVQSFNGADSQAKAGQVERMAKQLAQVQQQLADHLAAAEQRKSQAIAAVFYAVNARDSLLSAQLDQLRQRVETQAQQQQKLIKKAQQSVANGHTVDFAGLAQGVAELEQILSAEFKFDEQPPIRSIDKFGIVPFASTVKVAETPAPENGKPVPKEKKQPANGSPLTKVINGSDIQHATSQSSLVSSVGEDSGLGQVSPVQREKVRTQHSAGGIVMEAEGISADALAEIQRRLAESLKAQGIDEDILTGLSGLGGTQVVAPRRRQPRKDAPSKNGSAARNGKPIPSH